RCSLPLAMKRFLLTMWGDLAGPSSIESHHDGSRGGARRVAAVAGPQTPRGLGEGYGAELGRRGHSDTPSRPRRERDCTASALPTAWPRPGHRVDRVVRAEQPVAAARWRRAACARPRTRCARYGPAAG